jgi:hypothetical protein
MTKRQKMSKTLRENIAELWGEDMLFADGFDDAIVGVVHRCGQESVVCYDYDKCVEVLVKDGMDFSDAVEYLDFNVAGAWVGDDTPAILYRVREEFDEVALGEPENDGEGTSAATGDV